MKNLTAAEEYFGVELARSINKILTWAKRSKPKQRAVLAQCLRDEADKQPKDIVYRTLIRLAEHIEKMESKD